MKPDPRVVKTYNAVQDKVIAMGETLLLLLRHPDATPEQIDQARTAYREAHGAFTSIRTQLQKRYPGQRGLGRSYPWDFK